MPIGTIAMSDGRSGSVLRTDPTPHALVRPYDGGPAFTDPAVATTRFSHAPTVTRQSHDRGIDGIVVCGSVRIQDGVVCANSCTHQEGASVPAATVAGGRVD